MSILRFKILNESIQKIAMDTSDSSGEKRKSVRYISVHVDVDGSLASGSLWSYNVKCSKLNGMW